MDGDGDPLIAREIETEANSLRNALEYHLQIWFLYFPDPDSEDITWPTSFYGDVRNKTRNWTQEVLVVANKEEITYASICCMSYSALLEGTRA
jgi:hypothetical protein